MTGFTPEVRDAIRAGTQSSAAVLVPLIDDELFPGMDLKSVVDVGCGEGWFAAEFAQRGWTALGIDHPDTEHIGLPAFAFRARDLGVPLGPVATSQFDLCLSLEVAEHLPPERAASFVAELCTLAPIVVFSAAIPGQGGTGHLNEQWPAYWAELFAAQGYTCSGWLRDAIWDDDRIENWYRQNLLVAWSGDEVAPTLDALDDSPPRSLVHPVLWEHYRELHR